MRRQRCWRCDRRISSYFPTNGVVALVSYGKRTGWMVDYDKRRTRASGICSAIAFTAHFQFIKFAAVLNTVHLVGDRIARGRRCNRTAMQSPFLPVVLNTPPHLIFVNPCPVEPPETSPRRRWN